jgi:hypothetical protein
MASLDFAGPLPGVSQLDDTGTWEAFFRPMRADGIESGMTPSLDTSGRHVVLTAGKAFLRAYAAQITASSNATSIPAASGQDRVDRLVLRLDRTAVTAATIIVPTVLTGTPAASPQPPALTRSDDHLWDLPVCRWTSKANGSLASLIDEAPRLGGQVLTAASGAQPYPPSGRRLLVSDTQVLASLGGTTWDTVVYSDTGWQNLTLNGPNAGSWSLDGACRVRARNGVVRLRFAVMRAGTSSLGVNDSNGSVPFTLPPAFRPAVSEPGHAYSGFFNGPRQPSACLVNPDGTVQLFAVGFTGGGDSGGVNQPALSGPLGDIAVGSVIGGGATYLLG